MTSAVAARLAPGLRSLRRALEYDNGARLDPATLECLESIERLARAHRAVPVRSGTDGIPDVPPSVTITASEVAARVGISQRAVTAAAQRGTLPAKRQGRSWRFDPLDVEDWMDNR